MVFLHETMGITHGDLKPLNMLLHHSEVKLCDFGSSQMLQVHYPPTFLLAVSQAISNLLAFLSPPLRPSPRPTLSGARQHDLSELAFSATLPYMAPELLLQGVNLTPTEFAAAATASVGGGSLGGSTASNIGGGGATPPMASKISGGGATPPTSPALSPHIATPTGDASSHPGVSVDVYSFGVCLWELCSRVYPWHELLEAGRVEELKQRVGGRAERLESSVCPPPFRLIVEACWRQQPHRRPSFGVLRQLDLAGIGRGSAGAVRHMRELLWSEGLPEGMDHEQLKLTESSEGARTMSLESRAGGKKI